MEFGLFFVSRYLQPFLLQKQFQIITERLRGDFLVDTSQNDSRSHHVAPVIGTNSLILSNSHWDKFSHFSNSLVLFFL